MFYYPLLSYTAQAYIIIASAIKVDRYGVKHILYPPRKLNVMGAPCPIGGLHVYCAKVAMHAQHAHEDDTQIWVLPSGGTASSASNNLISS